jgi:hypothetical protein
MPLELDITDVIIAVSCWKFCMGGTVTGRALKTSVPLGKTVERNTGGRCVSRSGKSLIHSNPLLTIGVEN